MLNQHLFASRRARVALEVVGVIDFARTSARGTRRGIDRTAAARRGDHGLAPSTREDVTSAA